MALRALFFTNDDAAADSVTRSVASLPLDWIVTACSEQAAILVEQGDLDLVLMDCDSERGTKLFQQAEELQPNRGFRLVRVSTGGVTPSSGTVVTKPIDSQAFTAKLREILPLFG